MKVPSSLVSTPVPLEGTCPPGAPLRSTGHLPLPQGWLECGWESKAVSLTGEPEVRAQSLPWACGSCWGGVGPAGMGRAQHPPPFRGLQWDQHLPPPAGPCTPCRLAPDWSRIQQPCPEIHMSVLGNVSFFLCH